MPAARMDELKQKWATALASGGATKHPMTGAQWWLNFGQEYPTMQALAQRILPLRPSSTNVERVFSIMGFLQNERRNRLSPATVKHSVNIYMNSRMGKFANAFESEIETLAKKGDYICDIIDEQLA